MLNAPRYKGAQILLTRQNFGCGSSREHAPWALEDYGIRALVGPSFADIFFNNCFKNGVLPICLPEDQVETLFRQCEANAGYRLRIDLAAQQVQAPDGTVYPFEVDAFRKEVCSTAGTISDSRCAMPTRFAPSKHNAKPRTPIFRLNRP